ncbi:MAG: type IV pilus assembly protein PilM [bacterium]|nr:type IV pilus assembly protein PilM [bacterium]
MSVGLDIGSQTIKIVEIKKDGKALRLNASGVIGYNGVSPDQSANNKELVALSGTIKKLHKETKVTSKDVYISLPESLVFTRTIKFPMLTDQEIASAIKWESEQYIPIPISEAIIQYQVIERRENANPPEISILLVAARKDLVEKYVKLVQMAGLNVVGVETELLALVRALAPVDKSTVILDLGSKSTDIAISNNGQLGFSRSILTAGDALTRVLAKGFGIGVQQAEQYKRTYGLSQTQLEGKVKQMLDPAVKLIADEIKKAIQFYQSDEKGDPPASVIVTGGTAGMPELISSLSEMLGMEIVMGNPFAKLSLNAVTAKSLQGFAPVYSIAVGLALK